MWCIHKQELVLTFESNLYRTGLGTSPGKSPAGSQSRSNIAGDSTPFHSALRRPLIHRRCRGRIRDHARAHGCGCGLVRGIAVH